MAVSDAFIEKYDAFAKAYVDPVEVLFAMVADEGLEPGHRISAAKDLVGYRYPKLKSVDIQAGEGVKGVTFVMGPAQIIENQQVNVLSARQEFLDYEDKRMMLSSDNTSDMSGKLNGS